MTAITIVLDIWDPRRGGLEAYANDLALALHNHGQTVRILCARARAQSPVELRQLGGSGLAFYRRVDRLTRREQLGRILSLRHPGTQCQVFAALGGLLIATLAARRESEPSWWRLPKTLARKLSTRTRGLLRREAQFFTKAQASDLVLAPSELVRQQIQRDFPNCAARIEVTGLPVDDTRFQLPATAETNTAMTLLWIGNEPTRKGLPAARRVLRILRAEFPDTQLVLLGHGTEPFDRAEPGLVALGHTDPLPWLQRATLLLAPSLEDSFNLAVAEALACGLPVVTTAATGASMLIDDPRVGAVIEQPRDCEALAAACRSFREDHNKRDAERRRAAVSSCFREAHFHRVLGLLGAGS